MRNRVRLRSTASALLWGAALSWACSSRKSTEPSATAPTAPAPASPAPAARPPAPLPPAGPSLEALPPPVWVAPSFRIATPRPGQRVTVEEAVQLEVVLEKLGGAALEGDLQVALDGHAFRVIRENRVPLRRLLLEDEELAPGRHRLVALRDGEQGRALVATWFRVEEAGSSENAAAPGAAPPPGLVLVSPRGTFHGDAAADEIRLDAFALDEGAFQAREGSRVGPDRQAAILVRVTGPSGMAERRTRGEPLRIVGLGSGDHRIEAFRVDAAGRVLSRGPWATNERTITVNRDSIEAQGGQ